MSQPIKLTGIVLSTMPIGEYDKRLLLLTKEKGKIGVFAKGSRRPTSQLLSISQVFSFGEFYIYQGKTSNTITQGNLINSFQELRKDISQLSYGMYFIELLNSVTNEEEDCEEYLRLLYKTLQELIKKRLSNDLIRCIFELKTLSLFGLYPQVTECLYYDETICDDNYYFSVEQGGIVCFNNIKNIKEVIKNAGGTIYTKQYILSSELKKLYNFSVNESILYELKNILKKYINYHIGNKFKTLEVIEVL